MKQNSLTIWGNRYATMGQVCNSGAMFVTAYLLILAWQKDYGNAATAPQQQAAVVSSHEASADLPKC